MLSSAAFKKGNLELGAMFTVGSYKYENSQGNYTSSRSSNFLFLNSTVDYYLIDGLSVQPEYDLIAFEDATPQSSLFGNVSYTYLLPESKIGLYARGGVGVGTGVPTPNLVAGLANISMDWDVLLLQAGIGSKFMVGNSAFVKLELNYRYGSKDYSQTYGTTTYSGSTNNSFITLFCGLGINLD